MINSLLSTTLSNAVTALALALAAMVVTRFVRRPAIAQALWILVLVKLISPAVVELPLRLAGRPLFTLPASKENAAATTDFGTSRLQEPQPPGWTGRSETGESKSRRDSSTWPRFSETRTASPHAPAKFSTTQIVAKPPTAFFPKRQSRWQDLLVAIWLGGFAIWFGVVAFRVRQFRKWLRKTQPASVALRAEIDQLVREIGLRRAPELLEVDGICPPLTWAMWGRPVVLLPRSLIGSLTSDERRTLLLHELAHLRRRDHWMRWLELIVTGLQWWQPLAWLARRKLHLASEQCCDAFVVGRFPELARTYAATLLKTVDFLADAHTPLPIGATGFGEARQLKRRLEMILKGCVTDRLSSKLWIGFALVALVVMPLSIRAIWAEPTKQSDFLAQVATPSAGDTDGSKSRDTVAAPPAKLEEHPKAGDSTSNLDERMRRLEATVERLARAIDSQRPAGSEPNKAARSPDIGAKYHWLSDSPQPPDRAESVVEELCKDLEIPEYNKTSLDRLSAEVGKQLTECQTNFNRRIAALRQCEAVKAAYDAGTVTLDLVLESQRTKADAEYAYAESVVNLSQLKPEAKQRRLNLLKYRFNLQGRDEALQTWKEIHAKYMAGAKGGEADREAQSREQYFLFRAAVQSSAEELLK
jgi:beta-lactamase regulating signal transducer with metallopeptidase domain